MSQNGSGRRSRLAKRAAVVTTAALLTVSSVFASAQEQEPPSAQAELMELFEYLGSWDGLEEDWLQFLGDADDPGSAQFYLESDQFTQEAGAGAS